MDVDVSACPCLLAPGGTGRSDVPRKKATWTWCVKAWNKFSTRLSSPGSRAMRGGLGQAIHTLLADAVADFFDRQVDQGRHQSTQLTKRLASRGLVCCHRGKLSETLPEPTTIPRVRPPVG